MGKTIRSAKMKLTTPPKLIPPFQSTAANGILPTEHTKLTIATNGPTSGPSIFASVGLLLKKKARQKESGTQASLPWIDEKRPPGRCLREQSQGLRATGFPKT